MGISQLENIVNQFELKGKLFSCQPYGNGHINDTYLVELINAENKKSYILQRINKKVFKEPLQVIHNIEKVLDHLKLKRMGVLKTYKSSGLPFVIDSEKNYWRLYNFIPQSKSFEIVTNKTQAFEAAKCFAEFQKAIIDLCTDNFYDTIPNFHNLEIRLAQFKSSVHEDVARRIINIKPEIAFIRNHQSVSDDVMNLVQNNLIPIRLTHNDTKLNNVLFDNDSGESICVIDLDTLMPGSILYDFGDMVRTFTSPVAEDELMTEKSQVRIEIFEEICRGYLSQLKNELTENEKNNLLLGAKYMMLIIAVRFITDYLKGDIYFKTQFPDHNLVRARNQFALILSLEEQEDELNLIIQKYINN